MIEIVTGPFLFESSSFLLSWHGVFSFIAVATAVFSRRKMGFTEKYRPRRRIFNSCVGDYFRNNWGKIGACDRQSSNWPELFR